MKTKPLKAYEQEYIEQTVDDPPVKINRATMISKILATQSRFTNPISGQVEFMSVGQAIAFSLIRKALGGDIPAIKECLDSAYGPVKTESQSTQTHEVVFRWDSPVSEIPNGIEIKKIGSNMPANDVIDVTNLTSDDD